MSALNPERGWLEPAREQDVLRRMERIHGSVEAEVAVSSVDALWMAWVLRGLLEERVGMRLRLDAALARVREMEQGQTILPGVLAAQAPGTTGNEPPRADAPRLGQVVSWRAEGNLSDDQSQQPKP